MKKFGSCRNVELLVFFFRIELLIWTFFMGLFGRSIQTKPDFSYICPYLPDIFHILRLLLYLICFNLCDNFC